MDAESVDGERVDKGRREKRSADESSSGRELGGRDEDEGRAKPRVGMEFDSEDSAKTFYESYATREGFGIQVGQFGRGKPDGPIITWEFSCSKEVYKKKNVETCNAMMKLERRDAEDRWEVTRFVEEHNHSLGGSNKVQYLRPRRHFAGAAKNSVDAFDGSAEEGNHVTYELNHGVRSTAPVELNRPARTFQQASRKRNLGRDAQNLLNYFKKMQTENPGFFYAIQLDDESRMTNVFWADARSRSAYSHFGDAVVFDTMYRPNQYQVPFAPFTGINHHGQAVLFGCALLLDESEASFAWLFKTWLSAMNNRAPVSMTTDQDRAIQAAVARVFPETRHCICKWHILREGQERLAHVYLAHPSLYGELYGCINFSEAVEDFESSWASLLEKYDLRRNEWLVAVYNARRQWAPVYFRGTFFGALSPSQCTGSFFDGYVTQQTTLPAFFKQYERALERSFEREIEADRETLSTTPVLKTPSPMEQQAASLYTKKVFAKFQDELVETFVYTANNVEGDGAAVSKFRVAKYEHDDKAYTVTLNATELKASCSCQMFEYAGILCRHILTVFTVTNVLTLPSHYILKRWTRKAKASVAGPDESNTDLQSIETLTARFNNLCRAAIKYAEEGSTAIETYNAAMSALREGGKKIMAAKKNIASSQDSGNAQEDGDKKGHLTALDMVPSLWPWQEANQFNLNDVGIPVSDLNQPSSVSIHRDSGPSDNTVVLTCFKSMTWVIENKNSAQASKVALISMKLQDYGQTPAGESKVQFRLSRVTLEPMLRSMAYISRQLAMPANKVAVINLKRKLSTYHIQTLPSPTIYLLAPRYEDNNRRNGGKVSSLPRYVRFHVEVNDFHPGAAMKAIHFEEISVE